MYIDNLLFIKSKYMYNKWVCCCMVKIVHLFDSLCLIDVRCKLFSPTLISQEPFNMKFFFKSFMAPK